MNSVYFRGQTRAEIRGNGESAEYRVEAGCVYKRAGTPPSLGEPNPLICSIVVSTTTVASYCTYAAG